jgi:hypothetical protein
MVADTAYWAREPVKVRVLGPTTGMENVRSLSKYF